MPCSINIDLLSVIDYMDILDIVYKIAMVILGLSNAIIAWKVFRLNTENSSFSKETTESSHKVLMFKTLILDYNVKFLYDSFGKIEKVLSKLKERDANRKDIEKDLTVEFKNLYDNFIYIIMSVDKDLYDKLKTQADACRDNLVQKMSEEGYNYYIDKMFKEHIEKEFLKMKKGILAILFGYNGCK